jgi:starvation-inducible DNA-binding protein
MEPKLGIAPSMQEEVVECLGTILANEVVLYIKTRNYHWNVVGPNFSELHDLFGSLYEEGEAFMDDTAERIRQLGDYACGSMKEFLEEATLKEEDDYPSGEEMIKNLLLDHEEVIRCLRKGIKEADDVTANFLTDLMGKHEKIAWKLRSYLE